MSEFLKDLKRTHDCGALRAGDVGKPVVLFGWVSSRRDHGGCVFVDLRDRGGFTQIVFEPSVSQEAHTLAGELRSEFCIGITGTVVDRGAGRNPKIPTGEIEVHCNRLTIFSRSETPPFELEDAAHATHTNEQLRLKHRALDLRRPSLQKNFLVRSAIYQTARRVLTSHKFLEIETPFMVKYTPGGARNFLVPSRLNPGTFYALAESPQIFKQLFMVAGFDRYFQIVRCFRDEDLRQDRQPEFTQIDVEMSFVVEEDVQGVIEDLMSSLWKEVLGLEIATPFARMTYDEAIGKYGSDKPDLRFDLPLTDVTEIVKRHDGGGVEMFRAALSAGRGDGVVKGWRLPAAQASKLPRSAVDKLEDFAKGFGARGLARARVGAGGVWTQSPIKGITDAMRAEINTAAGLGEGDLFFLQFGARKLANTVLGALRLHLANQLEVIPKGQWKFCWITEFPLFDETDDGKLVAAHHPFTSPLPEDLPRLETAPATVRARAYDLVLNGNEVAGGSIRIHSPEVQARVFEATGLTPEDARTKFGFLLDAFKYGPPPHGGIAAGLDRLAMLLCGAESLREVIAFPKTQKGTDLCTDAPGPVSTRQLDELHIALKV